MECTVWTTKNCNLNCKYCYEHKNKEVGNMINYVENQTLNKIKKLIMESNEDMHVIQFHGGEPLLNFKLIKRFVNEIEDIKGSSTIKYGMTTNGTIWNIEIEKFFEDYKDSFSGYISISIDGDSRSHNKNRIYKNCIGSFDKVIKTAQKMKLIFENLRCRVTVTPNTIEDLHDNIRYLVDIGFKQISVAFDLFSNEWNENHISIIEEQYQKTLSYWKSNSLQVEISIVDEIIGDKKVLGICYPNTHFYIDGLIYPCTFVVGLEEYSIGNILDGIHSEKVKDIINISSIDNKKCEKCNNRRACSSNRCKLINKVITGDYYTPPTINCILENIQIKNKHKVKETLSLV